jgi:hypothetical protein
MLLPSAHALPITFTTGVGATVGGQPVSAEALFSFDVAAHTLSIQLLNLEANPTSVVQLISGIEFDFTHLASGSLGASITSAHESTYDIQGGGVPVADQENSTWIAQTLSNTSLSLCEICKLGGGGGPHQLIIGGPDPTKLSTDTYSNANGSIAGNGPHNPFILGSGDTYSSGPLAGAAYTSPTWVLNVPLLTADTQISQVRFIFGTSYDGGLYIPPPPGTNNQGGAPEPGTLAMMLGGIALVVGSRVSRRFRK